MIKLTYSNKFKNLWIQTMLIMGLLFVIPGEANAQFALYFGGNLSNVHSKITLENKKPNYGYNFGFSVRYQPFTNKNISLINEMGFSPKGYVQEFEEDYNIKFSYMSFPILVDYGFSELISMQGGIELSSRFYTSAEEGFDTYNKFDLGLVAGISLFNNKTISCFTRATYGLLPVLDYYEIDPMGNFSKEVHDFKNICFTAGIKLNFIFKKNQSDEE